MARAAPCSSSHEVRPNFLSLDEAIDAVRGSFSTRPIGRRPTACASERAAPSGPRLDLRNRRPATCGSCRLGRACRGLDQERRRRSSGVARGSSFENPSRRPRRRPPAIASAEDLARPSAAERAKIRRAEARQDLLRPVVVQRKRIPSPSPDMSQQYRIAPSLAVIRITRRPSIRASARASPTSCCARSRWRRTRADAPPAGQAAFRSFRPTPSRTASHPLSSVAAPAARSLAYRFPAPCVPAGTQLGRPPAPWVDNALRAVYN